MFQMIKSTGFRGLFLLVGLIIGCGSILADGERIVPVPTNAIPFEMTRHAVLKGVPLKIGDLKLEGDLDADQQEPLSRELAEACEQQGPEWLQSNRNGEVLEVLDPYGKERQDESLAAYCSDEFILVGGVRRRADHDPTMAWLFIMADGLQSSPVEVVFTSHRVVTEGVRKMKFELNAVRSIDPDSGRIFFAGTAADGEKVLLSAPFALVTDWNR